MVDVSEGSAESGPRLTSADFTRLFPFYLEIGADGVIRKAGPALMRSCPGIQTGRVFTEVVTPLRPEEPLNVEKLRNSPEVLFLIQDIQTGLRLRGQWLAGVEGRVIFVGSPWLSDAAEMSSHNLSVNDFAIHDPAVDLLHILRTQKMATSDLRRLTEKLTAQSAKLKQTNARIVEQEAESRKLALIAARTHNAVVLTDAQGRTEWVNQGFSRLTGYTFAEIKGRSPGSLLQGPKTDPEKIAFMQRCIARGEGFDVELLNYTKSGQPYWIAIEAQPITDSAGRVTHYMAIESDITSRRRTEADLRCQFEVSKILASDATLDDISPKLLEILGRELEWEVANFWLFHPDPAQLRLLCTWSADPALNERFLARANQPVLPFDIGLPGLTWRTLQTEWVPNLGGYPACPRSSAADAVGLKSAVGFPIHLGDLKLGVIELISTQIETRDAERQLTLESIGGQIAQYVERTRSRDELSRRSEDLARLNRELELANRAKDEFLASISHEIRTPLNGVIGTADILNLTSLDAHQREALDTLSTSANHLHALLNDVLDFSRIEADRLELAPEAFLLSKLLEDVSSIFLPMARQKGLDFRLDHPPLGDLTVWGDATRIRQIIVNLLGNAFKFTQNGYVDFSVHLYAQDKAIHLEFVVEDSGIGIPASGVKLLFKPFNQLDSKRTRTYGGTGLGLAISHRLARLMQGDLRHDPSHTPGSRFIFTVTLPESDTPAKPTPEITRLQAGGDLLIVDDHAANATILTFMLSELGLSAQHCSSANAALEYCRQHRPPLIFMDVHMPTIDGLEATRLIRAEQSPDAPHMPIIALTADVRPEVRRTCLEAGMDEFLSKPIRLAELHAMLVRFFPQKLGTVSRPPIPVVLAPTQSPDAIHGLDSELLEMLFGGDQSPEMVNEVKHIFQDMWDEVPGTLDKIERACHTGALTEGQALCHRLRGVLSNYGFQLAGKKLEQMEYDASVFRRPAQHIALRAVIDLGYRELVRRYPFLR
jgi:two-component system, sensor histidine kinase and response regulator